MSVLDEDIESLKRRTSELLEQQRDNEAAFAQQRAKFMELFKQKEGFRSKMFAVMLDLNCSFFSFPFVIYLQLPESLICFVNSLAFFSDLSDSCHF